MKLAPGERFHAEANVACTVFEAAIAAILGTSGSGEHDRLTVTLAFLESGSP